MFTSRRISSLHILQQIKFSKQSSKQIDYKTLKFQDYKPIIPQNKQICLIAYFNCIDIQFTKYLKKKKKVKNRFYQVS